MTDAKIVIDPSMKSSTVTVTAEPLTVDLNHAEICKGPAAAIASALSDAIRAKGWFNTGTLANGIAVESSPGSQNIVAPPDRLQRPDLLARFLKEIPDPSRAPVVKEALTAVGAKIVKVGKRR